MIECHEPLAIPFPEIAVMSPGRHVPAQSAFPDWSMPQGPKPALMRDLVDSRGQMGICFRARIKVEIGVVAIRLP